MKIAVFTEMQFRGKIDREHKNMRTEFAWMVALDATHHHLSDSLNPHMEKFDLGIAITPKNNPSSVNIEHLKTMCDKVAIMQEGPFWLYQDYDLENQINYYNNLVESDIIFTHNEQDRKYYKGLTNHKDVRVLPSLMISDAVGELPTEDRSGIMIGGNMVSWYGGFDSYMLANSVTDEIYQPKMGRALPNEQQLGITQLPYLQWSDWIRELNKRKMGVHMMRTHAAGTFALNCSYLGIPCVGYEELDTQRILHPNLSVENGDLETARELVKKLWNDLDFYKESCILTQQRYKEHYGEKIFKERFEIG
tara:strand:- start:49 stop:969 length:921 start_codon:yes stop_codon:yes gene_type:complete